MGPNFKKAEFISDTSLKVTGTFDTHSEVIGDVIIRILVIPEGHAAAMTNPMVGQAERFTLSTSNNLTSGSFKGTVTGPKDSYTVAVGDTVRLIGVSVAVKAAEAKEPPEAPDPAGFETFTWCVSRVGVAEEGQAA